MSKKKNEWLAINTKKSWISLCAWKIRKIVMYRARHKIKLAKWLIIKCWWRWLLKIFFRSIIFLHLNLPHWYVCNVFVCAICYFQSLLIMRIVRYCAIQWAARYYTGMPWQYGKQTADNTRIQHSLHISVKTTNLFEIRFFVVVVGRFSFMPIWIAMTVQLHCFTILKKLFWNSIHTYSRGY